LASISLANAPGSDLLMHPILYFQWRIPPLWKDSTSCPTSLPSRFPVITISLDSAMTAIQGPPLSAARSGPRFASCRFLLLAGYENLAAPLFALPR
jgi:hypothetical protein